MNFGKYFQSTLPAMADRAKKRGRRKDKKHDNLRTKRAFDMK